MSDDINKARVYRLKKQLPKSAADLPAVQETMPEKPAKPARKVKAKPASSKKLSKPLTIAIAACSIVFVFSAAMFLKDFIPQLQAQNERNEMVELGRAGNTIGARIEEYIKQPPDFAKLASENREICAWITAPVVEVDDPIVQHSDNDYYLTHSAKKKNSSSGAIFLDYNNSPDFTDQNTVVYGHAMNNGSMFGKLFRYRDSDAYTKDPFIIVYLPDERVLIYKIFAVVEYDATEDYRSSYYGDKFGEFLSSVRARSKIRSTTTVTTSDKIITLSTCTNRIENGRLAVFGVLLNPDGEEVDFDLHKKP